MDTGFVSAGVGFNNHPRIQCSKLVSELPSFKVY
jgi:hypothetical protein